ncbi:MAG: hypothetical protein IJX47_05150 [Clostridia bacterium]|nr:hypothetical protein [Clostridia bacterium]
MKKLLICNYIVAGIHWILGILVAVFNVLALWEPWSFAGYMYYLWMFPSIAISIAALVAFQGKKEQAIGKKYWTQGLIVLGITGAMTILTLCVFSIWFW